MSDAEGKTEILIIKRGRGGGEEGHHGGVWKIAYADFMTAMMAFFLVMWLVNAANEKTKTQGCELLQSGKAHRYADQQEGPAVNGHWCRRKLAAARSLWSLPE
jgi:flagellar motor protein MotB